MGLTSWQGSLVRKGDFSIAKNYLKKNEIEDLNRIVTMYLDYAEDQASNHRTVTMTEWSDKLDAFLTFNEKKLLTHAGKVKAKVAEKLSENRYQAFDNNRRKKEAEQADADDIKEIEKMVKKLENKDGE